MKQGLIVGDLALPADKQATEAVQPRMRALDYPAPRLLARMRSVVQLSAAATDVTDVAPLRSLVPRTRIIVVKIQAQMLNQGCPKGAAGDQSVERLG